MHEEEDDAFDTRREVGRFWGLKDLLSRYPRQEGIAIPEIRTDAGLTQEGARRDMARADSCITLFYPFKDSVWVNVNPCWKQ